MAKKKIAWVESEPHINDDTRSFIELKKPGVEIELYTHAGAAWENLRTKEYNLIVVNPYLAPGQSYSLPNWGGDYNSVGLDLVGRIKQTDLNKKTPIVVISVDVMEGVRGEEFKQKFLKEGASEVADLRRMTLFEKKTLYSLLEKYLD